MVTKGKSDPAAPLAISSQHETSRLTGADGLRALACLGVLTHHLYQRLNVDNAPDWLQSVHGFLIKGGVGVGVFFVLSGILVSYKFWLAYFTKSSYPRIRTYLRRRASRILPGFYAALAVSYVIADVTARNDGREIIEPVRRLIGGVTLTSSFHWVTFFPSESNGPLWAIPMEAVCYVLLPLVMLGLFAIKRRGRFIGLGYWLAAIGLMAALQQWIIGRFPMDGYWANLPDGARAWMPGRNPVGYFGQFAIGVLAAAVIVLWKIHKKGRRSWYFDGIAVVAASGIVALFWMKRLPAEFDGSFSLQEQPYYYPTFALLVAALAIGLGFSRLMWRVFDNPFLVFTAKYSFGIYLWHMLILDWMARHFIPGFWYAGITDPLHHLEIVLVCIALSYVAAMLSWRLIERHFVEGRFSGRGVARDVTA